MATGSGKYYVGRRVGHLSGMLTSVYILFCTSFRDIGCLICQFLGMQILSLNAKLISNMIYIRSKLIVVVNLVYIIETWVAKQGRCHNRLQEFILSLQASGPDWYIHRMIAPMWLNPSVSCLCHLCMCSFINLLCPISTLICNYSFFRSS